MVWRGIMVRLGLVVGVSADLHGRMHDDVHVFRIAGEEPALEMLRSLGPPGRHSRC